LVRPTLDAIDLPRHPALLVIAGWIGHRALARVMRTSCLDDGYPTGHKERLCE
jgi:hypothetical protein